MKRTHLPVSVPLPFLLAVVEGLVSRGALVVRAGLALPAAERGPHGRQGDLLRGEVPPSAGPRPVPTARTVVAQIHVACCTAAKD